MIDKAWIEKTDRLIKRIPEVNITLLNGDILIAKQEPPKRSAGGIYLEGLHSKIESYFKGLGRIIALPTSGFASTNGVISLPDELEVGDFVLFSHQARYKPNPEIMNLLLEEEYEEISNQTDHNDEFHDRGELFFVAFPDIKLVKKGFITDIK